SIPFYRFSKHYVYGSTLLKLYKGKHTCSRVIKSYFLCGLLHDEACLQGAYALLYPKHIKRGLIYMQELVNYIGSIMMSSKQWAVFLGFAVVILPGIFLGFLIVKFRR